MTEPTAKCPFCEKTGLPILPLRYAVARTDYDESHPRWKALDLPSGFGAGVTDIALPADSACYTTRLLRPGYLYAFNEARGEWKAYLVTELGYLYEFDIEDTTPPDADNIEFSCFRTGEEFIARCITVPDAVNATRLWLGFSDTAWTPQVLARHRRHAYRERHMRPVEVGQWAGGDTSQPHTAEFTRLKEVVNEFVREGTQRGGDASPPTSTRAMLDPRTGEVVPLIDLEEIEVWANPAFDFSPHRFNGARHEADGLITWAEAAAEKAGAKAMLVALDDPTGITMELASLMGARLNEFLEADELQRPLAISALVDSLEEAIRNNAELDALRDAERQAVWRAHSWNYPFYISGRDGRYEFIKRHEQRLRAEPGYRAEWEAKLEAARQEAADGLSEDDLERAADRAWRKYRSKLRPGEPEQWRETVYQPRLEDYDQGVLVPLAHAHQAWLRGPATAACFECNHDEADGDSGAGYVQTLLLCIQDTQQNQVCFDNYVEWLSANTEDPGNLLQRALVHNQQDVIDALNEAVPSAGLPKSELPSIEWGTLVSVYQESLGHVNNGGQNLAAQLLVALGGPVIKVVDGMIDHTAGRLLVSLGVISHAPILPLTHAGTVDQALDVMVEMMKQVNPEALGDIDAGLLKRQLQIRSRGRRHVTQTRGPGGRFAPGQVTLRVDRFALGQIAGGGAAAERADQAALTVLTMDEWPKNGLARFRAMFGTNARLAVVGLILQIVDAKQMAGKLDATMEHRRVESNWRFGTSVAAIVGGVGNLLHDGIVDGAKAGSVRLAKWAGRTWVEWTGRISRGLGIVTAGIMAVMDSVNAYREARKGNVGMVALYLVSAGTGFGAAVLFTAWGASIFGLTAAVATGIGIVLVIVGIAIALLIEFLKTNELQEWMERCLFGALDEGDRYQEFEVEMEQFEMAMRALGMKAGNDEIEDEADPALIPQAG
ncbi:T6SS effector BTH_I2691 family protein [Luteimonas abyssi]|uniref:T6SS effector BTH_I2691 family protein n=1 Tax=Luteimonas abyssi TaxID=1247514 RepID=UPI000737D3DB|nr:T6SS effector BTH_I2691 family protein [Luteimonas abyssi]